MNKLIDIKNYILTLKAVAVAFSGGTDSALLLYAAQEALKENVLAITIDSPLIPDEHIQEAIQFCRKHNIRHKVIKINQLNIDDFSNNPPERCYICKKAMFTQIKNLSESLGIKYVCEGSNIDDLSDYRPGMRAISELGIISPLKELGLTKDEIRDISKRAGLSTHDKPSFSCHATRIAYGEAITFEKLGIIQRGEKFLNNRGFSPCRVRIHDKTVRIEVPKDRINDLYPLSDEIHEYFTLSGFSDITIDEKGFCSGSMNEYL